MTRITAPKEWQEQAALMQWVRLHEAQEPRLALLFAVANGELRDKRTAAKLERMGVRAGVSDLFLSVPRPCTVDSPGYHGLYLELKHAGGGGTTTAQQYWLFAVRTHGYAAMVCHGWVEAVEVLCWYLEREDLGHALL